MPVQDTAVGAILHIDDTLLTKIKTAEDKIKSLGEVSERVAKEVSNHWGTIAPQGLQTFIGKIAQAQEAIKGLGGSTTEVKFNTESATQQMSNFTDKVQSDSSKISQSLQEIASTPVNFNNVKEEAEMLKMTFKDVQDKIKALRNGLKVQETEGTGAQAQLQTIKAWEDYYKSVSKVNEEKDKMARKTADIEKAISNVRAQIDHENQAWERSKTKIDEAQKAIDQFKQTNPTFNWRDAMLELDRLKEKYNELYEKFKTAPSTDLSGIRQQMDATRVSFEALDKQLLEYDRLLQRKRDAEENASGESYQKSIARLQERYDSLTKDLEKTRSAQASFNAELEKGNTAKSLASEYAKLTKRLQEVNDAMNKYQAAGGTVATASFQSLQTEWQNIMVRRKEIEKMDIAEVNQYRLQMAQSAYQADLSAFIQNEAQKTAEAKKQSEQQSNDRIQAYQKFLNTYQGAMSAVNRLGTRGGDWADSYENRARVIKNLEAAIRSLKTTDADYERKLNNLTTALNNLKNKQQEVNNAMTSQPKPNVADAQWLANVARGTKTLEDYKRAYDVLIEVMARTPKNSTDFKNMSKDAQDMKRNIEEVEKAMAKFRNQSQQTSNIMGQLQGRIAAAFSVGAITGFIKKMVDVRAQFELQRVALGAIIQDRDEANKIFTQVQNMALESPFNIMQLEKATKQIAAFGFETQKLVPTMKMFADISAGLGVEIDRLVLVMGHLKARNFLEGTMVRQFTNMGFNVLGELSKYYTELEGKMVSVGEVQDRVKKKMISFEDVEEVLKRVTSAGGMFYDMQKKQSDSLWGQMQRIQDAYDLMLNEIGQSNEGILKSALATIRNLINHWRDLKPIIVSVVAAMGTFGASMFFMRGLPAILTSVVNGYRTLRICILEADKAQTMLNASTRANAWGALLSIIVAVGVAIYEVATAQSKLNEELGRIEEEGLGNMYNLIFQYRQLADTIKDTNKTYEERKEAMDEMKRVYGEILPDQMLEIDNIKKMKDGYNEATEAIKAHYEEKIKAQKEEAIKGDYEKKIKEKVEDAAERFTDSTYDAITKGMGLENIPEDTYRRNIENILTAITKEVEDGITPAEEASKRFKEVLMQNLAMSDADYKKISQSIDLNKAFEDAFSHQEYHGNRFGKGYFIENSILSTLQDMNDKIKKESESIFGNLNAFMAPDAEPYVKQYELLTQAVGKYKQVIESLYNLQSEGNLFDKDGKLTKDAESLYNELNGWIEKINESGKIFGLNFQPTSEDLNNAIQSNIDKMEYFERVNVLTFGHVTDSFDTWGAKLKNNTFLSGLVENWRRAWQQLNLSDEQREIRNLIKTVGELNNVDLSKYKWALIDSKDNVASVAKEVKAEVKSLKDSIEKYQTAVAAGLPAMIASAFFLGGKTLEEVQQTLKAVDELSHKLGNADKASKGNKSDKELKRWQDLKKAIESVQTAYDKARKSFTTDESNKMIEERWGDVFKALGADIKDFYKNGVYDMNALVKAYDVLIEKAKKAATTEDRKKYLSEIIAAQKDTEIEINVKLQENAEEQLKKQLDDILANVELTKELSNIGLSVDLTYLVGGKPTTLAQARKEIEKMYKDAGGESASENDVKMYKDALAKIADLELKAQKERLKNLHKYTLKAVSDRMRIEMKAQEEINKIRQSEDMGEPTKQLAIDSVLKKKQSDLDKLAWDTFKSSDLYIDLFDNIEYATKESIDFMIAKIESLKDSLKQLPADQVRAIVKQLDDLKERSAKLSDPFGLIVKNIGPAIAAIRKAKNAQKELNLAMSDLEKSKSKKSYYNDLVVTLGEQLQIAKANKNVSKEEVALLEQQLKEAEGGLQIWTSIVNKQEQGVKSLKKQIEEAKGLKEKLAIGFGGVSDILGSVSQAIGQIKDDWQQIFGTQSDTFNDTFDTISEITGALSNLTAGLQKIMQGDIIGGVIGTVTSLFSTIAAFFAIGDKAKERQIKRLQESVESLDKAYQKLEKSIESAYNFSQYNAEFNKMEQNLAEQKSAYEEMLALEEDKKLTDKDKIKEYEDKLDDIAEKEEELRKKRHEMYGSTDDVWSEANNWVDAWLDAYKESGDGLDALGDKWDEFYENLVKKQAASKIISSRMNDFVEKINEAIDKNMDEYGYVDAFKQIGEEFKSKFGEINEGLKAFFEYAGIGGNGELVLSDLQKGIQNITEPQAAAIEAYLNSMRFAVFRHTEQLDTLIMTIQAQYGSGAENPVVTELKGIRGVLDSIHSTLKGIIQTAPGKKPSVRIMV